MELLDVLDRNGIATGRMKEREEIHRDGDWHRAVHVWIVNNKNEVLIQKRSSEIDLFKNFWDISLAGHVRAGERSEDAAWRELNEELNIVVRNSELESIGMVKSWLEDKGNHDNQFCDIYFLRKDVELREIKKQGKEVAETALMPLHEFKKLIYEDPERFVPRMEEYEKMFDFLAS